MDGGGNGMKAFGKYHPACRFYIFYIGASLSLLFVWHPDNSAIGALQAPQPFVFRLIARRKAL